MGSFPAEAAEIETQAPRRAVRVWLLQGKYGGDNAQVLGLGEHLTQTYGWSCETRRVRFHPYQEIPRERVPDAIDFAAGDADPPWPDVVIACGRFYGNVARWLKRRAGGAIVQVQLGRIGAPVAAYDLAAATAQYGVPATANFIPLTLPITRSDPIRQAASLEAWTPQLAGLPRPWTLLMVGGRTAQIAFGKDEVAALLARAKRVGAESKGSVIVVFSQRTRPPIRKAIHEGLDVAEGFTSLVFDWPPPSPNPYPALLALADRFLVTSDSASMIADACVTGKPVELIRLPMSGYVNWFSSRGLGISLDARRRRRWREGRKADALDRLRDALVRHHWIRVFDEPRDYLHAVEHAGLVGSITDDKAAANDRARQIQRDEIAEIGRRIAALVEAKRGGALPRG